MAEKIKFSIVIPVKELNNYLEESIPKMLEMSYRNFEIIILPNEMPRNMPEYSRSKKVRFIASGRVSPSAKRDTGAEKARGEYVAFIDDDAYPTKNWLEIAERLFKEKKADAIGGPGITPDSDKTSARASGIVYETFLGGGGTNHRYKPAKSSFYTDDLPSVNLVVSKNAFLDAGGFNSDFWPGEDTKFCLDFIKKGYKIWYSNELVVYHHRRPGILKHLKQAGTYGKHRGYFAKRYPQTSMRLQYFLPSLFLIINLFFLVASFFSQDILKIWLVLILAFISACALDVFSRTESIKAGMLAILLIPLTHFVYGAMFIIGISSRNLRSKLR